MHIVRVEALDADRRIYASVAIGHEIAARHTDLAQRIDGV